MKKENKLDTRPTDSPLPKGSLFDRISIPFFGDKDRLPVRNRGQHRGKWSRRSLLWLTLISAVGWLVLQKCKSVAAEKGLAELSAAVYDNYLYRHEDCDYQLYDASTMCTLPRVLSKDYREYEAADQEREKAVAEGQDVKAMNDLFMRQRPKININRLTYFEKLTRDRVRLVFDNGACEIIAFEDLTYNIQEAEQCTSFKGIPRNGEVTEFVNLLYIESFEKVLCEGKELYRAQLAVTPSSCAILRTIEDCGVGLFSVYVYRNLRKRLEELNPGVDFKYRGLAEGCEC